MKFKNHPRLELWMKRFVRRSRDSVRRIQASSLSESQLMLPDFLGIGAPRAASTWLHSQLSLHPDVYIPHRKELHFFDQLNSSGGFKYDISSLRDRRLYATFFREGKGRLRGEITPAYSCLPPERVSDIVQFLPDVKIIYILRNPVERAWSGMRRRCWYGEGKTADKVAPDTLLKMAKLESLLIRGDYRRNIDVWESQVSQDRIHYIFYDDISADGSAELDKLCRFLGIAEDHFPKPEKIDKIVNEAPGSAIPDVIRDELRAYYVSDQSYLEAKFNRDLSSWYC